MVVNLYNFQQSIGIEKYGLIVSIKVIVEKKLGLIHYYSFYDLIICYGLYVTGYGAVDTIEGS